MHAHGELQAAELEKQILPQHLCTQARQTGPMQTGNPITVDATCESCNSVLQQCIMLPVTAECT